MIRIIGRLLLLFICLSVMPREAKPQVWTVLGFDPKDDGRNPALADAAQLSYRYDKSQDLLWFRISLYGRSDANVFGINIAVASFNKEVLADPVNGFYKPFFQDPWPQFSKNPNIPIVTIPDSRVLILDDQPKAADEAIMQFTIEVQSSRTASKK